MFDLTTIVTAYPIHMWFTFMMIGMAIVLYASDRVSIELTSMMILVGLLGFFHFFPLFDANMHQMITTEKLLLGFANPALIAVVSLLIIGQAVVQTGALNEVANIILKITRNHALLAIVIALVFVMIISGLLNNTPVVVIFIPIMAAITKHIDLSVSAVMIPLSFAAIIGGMMTLIGSSTNLLVSGTLMDLGLEPLGFFDFTIPGSVLAVVGILYVIFIAPKLLPDRASLASNFMAEDTRKFIVQVEVEKGSELTDKVLSDGALPAHKDITIRMVQRAEHAYLPPFDDEMTIKQGDLLVLSATKKDYTELFAVNPELLTQLSMEEKDENQESEIVVTEDANLAEVVITPTSRMVGQNLEQVGFHHHFNCVVLGIQRQSRVIRSRVTEIRLAAGDVLLIMGTREDILSIQESKDLLLMEWSTEEIHSGTKALTATVIFLSVVGTAALDMVPIAISAFTGALLVVATKCINARQAKRAIDSQIILMIAASLALGVTLQATGGASYLAELLIRMMHGASPVMVMSALFLLMVLLTNVLSNNATAVLFTPIAVNTARQLGVDPSMFIFAVVFACNCSFITPIGYQTNLLVMGPGHYRVSDFIRSGIPLALLLWGTYTLFAPWYFG